MGSCERLADYVEEPHRVLKPGVGSEALSRETNEFINIKEVQIVKVFEAAGSTTSGARFRAHQVGGNQGDQESVGACRS